MEEYTENIYCMYVQKKVDKIIGLFFLNIMITFYYFVFFPFLTTPNSA